MKLSVVLWKEEDVFVVKEVFTGVTTQGETVEEAFEKYKRGS